VRSVVFTSPWRRAPLLLLRRSPAVVVAVAAAGLVVGAAAAAEPLFLSSAGNAALAKQVAERCPADVGIKFSFQNDLGAGGIGRLSHYDGGVRDAAAAVPALGSRVLTMSSVVIFDVGRNPADRSEEGRLLFRTGALDHVTKLEDGHRPGVWLTDTNAYRLHLHAGQSVELSHSDRQLSVPIAGVYHDLAAEPPAQYWCSIQRLIRQVSIFTEYVPPQLILVDRPTYLSLSQQLDAPDVTTSWEVPVRNGITLSRAAAVPAQFAAGLDRASIGVPSGPGAGVQSELGFVVSRSRAIRGAVRRAISPIAIAGLLVALLLMGAAGSYWVERRSVEIRLLTAKGIGPGAIAVKALLEMTIPVLAGSLVGWALATRIMSVIGPSPITEGAAVRAGLMLAAWSGVISVALLGLVAGVRVRSTTERALGAPAGWLRWLPIEVVLLGGAAWSLSHITTHGAVLGSATQVPRVDLLPLAFPLLFLSGAVAMALRVASVVLGRLRSAGSRWPHSLYLTARRLAAAQRIALALLAATALSIGVLVYASALTRSSRASLAAKAQVFVGSDVRVSVDGQPAIPRPLVGRATLVRRPETVTAGDQDVDVIAVDRQTFAQAAFWDSSFGAGSLRSQLAKLQPAAPGQEATAILAHGQLVTPSLTYQTNQGLVPLPIRVVSQVGMFPAARTLRPLVIIDQSALAGRSIGILNELWAKGSTASVVKSVLDAGVTTRVVLSRSTVLDVSDFLATSWTFGFMQSLGVLIALITVGGLLLYLDTRQRSRRVSYAMARRMGLSRWSHLLSLAGELAATLVTGFALGAALSAVAARLVYHRLDSLPSLPPGPVLREPLAVVVAAGLAVLTVAALAATAAQRTADRTNLGEVLRTNE
jgi:putative ABC transport system permease protein